MESWRRGNCNAFHVLRGLYHGVSNISKFNGIVPWKARGFSCLWKHMVLKAKIHMHKPGESGTQDKHGPYLSYSYKISLSHALSLISYRVAHLTVNSCWCHFPILFDTMIAWGDISIFRFAVYRDLLIQNESFDHLEFRRNATMNLHWEIEAQTWTNELWWDLRNRTDAS